MKFSLVAALLTHAIASVSCGTVPPSPRCKNQDGQDVDWFIMYKFPLMQSNPENAFTPKGGEFVYVDSRSSQGPLPYWPLSLHDLYDAQNPVALTLAPLYENTTRKDILYFVYNDQPPPIYNGTRNAHSKGVLLFDDAVGVWLLHSVPKFVGGLQSGQYSFPDSGRENGQLFMCVTFPTPQVNTIARILRTEFANVYARQVPQSMQDKYPEVALLAKDSFVRATDQKLFIANLTSDGGTVLRAYGKRATLDEDLYSGVLANDLTAFTDLYSGVLANDLKDNLAVQSWRNGPGGKLPPACDSSYTVVNVEATELRFDEKNAVMFLTTEDHSKWAITIRKGLFCFASTNRMESQKTRGGEALCFDNAVVQALFKFSAIDNTGCPV